ncbi:hypothetical protein HQ576_00740 [bacterium]|nr:hypothetical protein [bacterium]
MMGLAQCVLLPWVLLATGAALLAAEAPKISSTRPDGTPNRAAWMARGSYGIMVHYLIAPQGDTPEEKTADLNRIAEQFDIEHFMKQFGQTGADWLIITLGQTTGYFCSPNDYLDLKAPGHTSRRDVVMEIAQALAKRDKRLILYLASARSSDPTFTKALGRGQEGFDDRYFEFIAAYAKKFGALVHGWWFDNCGRSSDEFWGKWMAASRAGNPQAALAFSGAEICAGGTIHPLCAKEDYHAGEIHLLEDGKIRTDFLPPGGDIVVQQGKLRKRGQEARYYLPKGQFIDSVQTHLLLPIDLTFNPAVPDQFCHYSDHQLFPFVAKIKRLGGAITINVPIDRDSGRIHGDSHAQLVRLGEWLTDENSHPLPKRAKTCWGTER